MIAQTGDLFGVTAWETSATHAVTIHVHNRDVLAEVSLAQWIIHDKNPLFIKIHKVAELGILQVVSTSGVESFNPPFPAAIYREGVVTITFYAYVHDCDMLGRYNIYYWS